MGWRWDTHLGALVGPTRVPTPRSDHPTPVHSTSEGLPSAHLLRSLPMLCSPLPPLPSPQGPTSSLDQDLKGIGGQVGGPGGGVGGRGKGRRRSSVTSRRCPLGRGSRKKEGVPGGYFSIFYFQIFLYLNLQICIIQGQPIKEEYNGAPRESRVCIQGRRCGDRAFPPSYLKPKGVKRFSLCTNLQVIAW